MVSAVKPMTTIRAQTGHASAASVAHERQLEALRRAMGPELLQLLADPQIVEIMLNPDGSLWVDRLGVGMERIGDIDSVRARSQSSPRLRRCSTRWLPKIDRFWNANYHSTEAASRPSFRRWWSDRSSHCGRGRS